MATRTRLRGSSDWADTAYWSGGVLPATNDDVRFVEGIDSLTLSLNQSAVSLSTLYFDSAYGDGTTVIGTAGAPLQIDVNGSGAKIVKVAARLRTIYLAGGSGGTISRIEFFPAAATCELILSSATVPTLILQTGTSRTLDSVTLTTVVVEDGDHTFDGKSGNAPNYECVGGITRIKGDWGTLNISGNAVVYIDVPSGITCGTITGRGDPSRSQLVWLQGDTGNVVMYSGILDLGQLKRDCTRGTLDLYSQATVKSERGLARLTGGTETAFGRGPNRRN